MHRRLPLLVLQRGVPLLPLLFVPICRRTGTDELGIVTLCQLQPSWLSINSLHFYVVTSVGESLSLAPLL